MWELLKSKRGVARVSVRSSDNLIAVLKLAQEHKLEFGIMPTPYQVTNIYGAETGRHRHDDEYEVYLGLTVFAVRQAMGAEADHDYRTLGQMYGYPDCCVDAFYETLLGEGHSNPLARDVAKQYPLLEFAIGNALKKPDQHYPMIMTPLYEHRVLSFFPCAFDCPHALAKAKERVDCLALHQPIPTTLDLLTIRIHFDVA
jgi:hypothetical protein